MVLAIDRYSTNAALIAACAKLGYIEGRVLDPTYGLGTFWNAERPDDLTASDLDPAKSPGPPADFTDLPHGDRSFDTVVFDPPYKLNGTPTASVDARYGVAVPTSAAERMDLCAWGAIECARVARRWLLIKCQDQVNSGRVWWQTRLLADAAEGEGFRLVDMLHMVGGRPQPPGRSQQHARRNYSTMLVLERVARDDGQQALL